MQQLRDDGPQYAMAMLLNCIDAGEPFVTYGKIAGEVEYQLNIDKIFSTHIGHVAGSLMDRILKISPKAPLINVLITRPDGIPGAGAGGYLADRYNVSRFRKWGGMSRERKLEIVQREREKIFKFGGWAAINEILFGLAVIEQIRKPLGNEQDGKGGCGGEAESEEHRALKMWVSEDSRRVGLSVDFGVGDVEARLQSGDEVDVAFSFGNSFRMVEVKSRRSNNEDFKRGIYQCVKYREVKRAEHLPYAIDVVSILVTERELSPEVQERAKLLGVKLKVVDMGVAP